MGTLSLTERIREAEQRRVAADLTYLHPAKPTPIRRARWLARATKDMTDSVLYNGAFVPGDDRGAA